MPDPASLIAFDEQTFHEEYLIERLSGIRTTPSSGPPQPRGTLEITTRIGCGVRCRFCPQDRLLKSYGNGRPRSLDLAAFSRLIDKVPANVSVHFSGMAEPWSNPECTEMVLEAARRGHLLSVYSTLIGMTEADFDRIRGVEYDFFVTHVPDAEGNSRIPVTPAYLSLLERVFGADLRVRSARQISCHGAPHPEVHARLRGRYPVMNEMLDRAGNVAEGAAVPCRLAGPITCARAGRRINRNVLLPDGTVLLCCMDYGMQHVLGNLFDSSYQELLEGAEARRIRAAMDDSAADLLCRKCTVAVPWSTRL